MQRHVRGARTAEALPGQGRGHLADDLGPCGSSGPCSAMDRGPAVIWPALAGGGDQQRRDVGAPPGPGKRSRTMFIPSHGVRFWPVRWWRSRALLTMYILAGPVLPIGLVARRGGLLDRNPVGTLVVEEGRRPKPFAGGLGRGGWPGAGSADANGRGEAEEDGGDRGKGRSMRRLYPREEQSVAIRKDRAAFSTDYRLSLPPVCVHCERPPTLTAALWARGTGAQVLVAE